jgi:hypothetical protein
MLSHVLTGGTVRLLFMSANNQYGVVSTFIDEMISDISLLNHHVDHINITSIPVFVEELSKLDLGSYDAVVSFTGIGLDFEFNGEAIIKTFQSNPSCKVYVYLVDHPIYQMIRFFQFDVTLLCVDKDHVQFAKACNMNAVYLPHGVCSSTLVEPKLEIIAAKQDEILFPVSYFDVHKAKQPLEPIWHDIGDLIESSRNITDFMQKIGLMPFNGRPSTRSLDNNLHNICIKTDQYQRALKRQNLLLDCNNANIKLTIIGRDVEQYSTVAPLHEYLPMENFSDLRKRIAKAKFLLHQQPGFENGLHERIIESAAQNTLVITQDKSSIPHLQPLLLDFDEAQNINNEEYLKRLQACEQDIAAHTWKSLWEEILENT